MIENLFRYLDSKNLKGWQIAIGVLSICGLVIALFILFMKNSVEETRIEHLKPMYWHNEDEFRGTVVGKEISPRVLGLIVNVKNESKNTLIKSIGWANNDNYNPSELANFVEVQDSLYKIPNSDSLIILRRNESFLFVIRKRIDKNNRFY